MKKTITLLTGALVATSMTGSAALVAGWDTWVDEGSLTYNPTATNGATAQASGAFTSANGTAGTLSNWSNATRNHGASVDGTWGSVATSAPTTDAANSSAAIGLRNEANGTFDFTITAAAGTTIDFTSFNFDAWQRFADAADTMQLSVLSGSISLGNVGVEQSITQAAGGADTMATTTPNDFDISLLGLADRQLLAGESAVFRMTFTGGAEASDTSNANNMMMDNVGIFGDITVIPEPSSSALLGIGALALVLRRRK